MSLKRLHEVALENARASIGQGEAIKNNEGLYVRSLMTLFRHRTAGPWCAAFISNMFVDAAGSLGMELPFNPSASARRLLERFAAVGSIVDTPAPGDIVVWWRGHKTRSRKGHIGIVDAVHPRGADPARLLFVAIEGNQGRYPAVVDCFSYRLDHKRLLGFARLY